MDHETAWNSIPAAWKTIFKKNLVFQSELILEQQSQSKFAARYYDMDTYWQVFFQGRELDLSITADDYAQILQMKKLKCGGTKIDSLSTLSRFGMRSLEYLDCNHTEVDSIDALSDMQNLRTLEIEYTRVSDLTPLRPLRNLAQLYISSTGVGDIGTLGELEMLTNLDLNDTKVDDLSPLDHLSTLETVVMNGCARVTDLSGLRNSRKLFKLDISGTGVSSIATLDQHPNLQILVAGGLDIDSIDVVSAMPGLESLYINNTRSVIDLRCLRCCKNLKALYIGGATVTGTDALLELASLTILFHSNLSQGFCEELARANPGCSITRH